MDSSFTLLSETVAYENPYFSILDRRYQLPDGTQHHFFVRKEVDTCCVLAQTKEEQFVAVREFRVGPGELLIELPAGRLEGFDDNPDERIKEEFLEETGYAGQFKKVGELPTSPYSNRVIHTYYATECEKIADQKLDETEFIEVLLLDPKEMREVLMQGKSPSCAAGLFAWEWMVRDGATLTLRA